MDLIASSDWRRKIVRRFGPHWMDPQRVSKSYDHLYLSAEVVGRDDVADALRQRLTPELFQQEAPLLETLRLLAGDWLEAPLPVFVESVPDTPTWAELMQGLSDRSLDFSPSSSMHSSNSSSVSDTSENSSFGEALQDQEVCIKAPTYMAPAIPSELSPRQVIDEARLVMAGFPSVLESVRKIHGLSSLCSQAYIKELLTQRKPFNEAHTLLQCLAQWRLRSEKGGNKEVDVIQADNSDISSPPNDIHEVQVKSWQYHIESLHNKVRILRPILARDWSILAGIFLGQDPRMLDYMWRCRHLLTQQHRIPAAAELSVSWPHAPFYLDNECIPVATSLAPETWNHVSRSHLRDSWKRILNAIAGPPSLESAILQCEMHKISTEVENFINSSLSLQIVFPLTSKSDSVI